MRIFGKEYTREELKQRIGDISQIAGIKSYTLNEGRAKGVDAMDVRTGSGFSFTVLPGRAMDIAWMDYKGMPVSYITKAGITNSQYYQPYGYEWLRSFYGGMLTTCGLTHVGPPGKDGIWDLGIHGRISNTPAEEVSCNIEWEGNELVLTVQGKMREAVLYEENMVLSRKIVARGGENKVFVYDEIKNDSYQDTPFMLLYHINIGFPLLSEQSCLIVPVIETKAHDEDAIKNIKQFDRFEVPVQGYAAQVFSHKLAADNNANTCAGIINESMGFGFYIKYNKKELPFFTEWKMMGQQDYVVGLEPGSCLPIGRSAAREKGGLEMLKPGERRTVKLELGILTSEGEIQDFKDYTSGIRGTD